LRLEAPVVAIWAGWGPASAGQTECRLAGRLERTLPFRRPFKGFGSSDCTCSSHLLYWPLSAESPSALRSMAIVHLDQTLSPLAHRLRSITS
jgi:Uri superfamily endonuclease